MAKLEAAEMMMRSVPYAMARPMLYSNMALTMAIETGLFDAVYKNTVTVYSPMLRMKTRRKPAKRPGDNMGKITLLKSLKP
jgi:hypothetical protein